MANKYTAIPMPSREELTRLYESGRTQAEVGRELGVTQKVVFGWFKRLKIQSRPAVKRNQRGLNNSSWRGDRATYAALHKRVEAVRGKPSECAQCGTTEAKKYEWCNLTGNYTDVNDYQRMCVKCHRQYDKNRKNSSKHVSRTAK